MVSACMPTAPRPWPRRGAGADNEDVGDPNFSRSRAEIYFRIL